MVVSLRHRPWSNFLTVKLAPFRALVALGLNGHFRIWDNHTIGFSLLRWGDGHHVDITFFWRATFLQFWGRLLEGGTECWSGAAAMVIHLTYLFLTILLELIVLWSKLAEWDFFCWRYFLWHFEFFKELTFGRFRVAWFSCNFEIFILRQIILRASHRKWTQRRNFPKWIGHFRFWVIVVQLTRIHQTFKWTVTIRMIIFTLWLFRFLSLEFHETLMVGPHYLLMVPLHHLEEVLRIPSVMEAVNTFEIWHALRCRWWIHRITLIHVLQVAAAFG